MNAYSEEFHRLTLKAKKQEEELERVARYLNGLRMKIQEEISLLALDTLGKCFQLALKVEEKLKRKSERRQGGRSGRNDQGRGNFNNRGQGQRSQGESNPKEQVGDSSSRGGYGGRGSNGGRSGGSGRGSRFSGMKCYNCGQLGHPKYKCPQRASTSQNGERRVTYVQEDNVSMNSPEVQLMREAEGENLMIRRTLLKEPVKADTTQRRALFLVQCKVKGKLCRMIIDSGSTNNIISLEVANKLKLERLPHSCPYKISWLNKG